MKSTTVNQDSSNSEQSSGINWHHIYCLLFLVVKGWVYSANVPSWLAQCDDIIADIVQETIVRTLKRIHRGNCGELPPVRTVENLCMKIARNCFIDMIRHDQRLLPITYKVPDCPHEVLYTYDTVDFSDVAIENVYTSSLFGLVVSVIVDFPPKLRTAILVDLAFRMSFKGEPTPLQEAFQQAGIDLEEYSHQVPCDAIMRSRHASLVSLAYKKISAWACAQEYILSAK
jgi:DNA-directed RNA polymerase specialized sigma24 family protein